MKEYLLAVLLMFLCLISNANHWEPNPYQYESNMISIGVVNFDGVEQRSENLEIGAFCVDECRGSAIAMYNSNFDRYFIFLMIYGNEGDEISFRVYDHQQGLEPEMEPLSSMVFHINGQEGSIDGPFEFAFATIEPTMYEITASVSPENSGEVSGTGTYAEGATCEIEAKASEGYTFVNLTENGNVVTTENVCSFQVTENHHFIANFELNQYEVLVSANPENSATVSGGGIYSHGSSCTVAVTPNEHWHFENWTVDGQVVSMETEYSFVVTENIELVANLYYFDDVVENHGENLILCPNPAHGCFIVNNITAEANELKIFDLNGKIVYSKVNVPAEEKVNVSGFAKGAYIVELSDGNSVKVAKIVVH